MRGGCEGGWGSRGGGVPGGGGGGDGRWERCSWERRIPAGIGGGGAPGTGLPTWMRGHTAGSRRGSGRAHPGASHSPPPPVAVRSPAAQRVPRGRPALLLRAAGFPGRAMGPRRAPGLRQKGAPPTPCHDILPCRDSLRRPPPPTTRCGDASSPVIPPRVTTHPLHHSFHVAAPPPRRASPHVATTPPPPPPCTALQLKALRSGTA